VSGGSEAFAAALARRHVETIKAGGREFEIGPKIIERLSNPGSKRGRTQRIVLAHLLDHDWEAGIPTTARFCFYELEQLGLATKPSPDDKRPNRPRSIGWPPGAQDITDALTHLRDCGIVPWSWLFDEERSLAIWEYADTIVDYLAARLNEARINPWHAEPPLVISESKATAGVLRPTVAEYLCPITGTKGQARGHLETEVARILRGNTRRVLYLGDLDRSGSDIEGNTRRVLERAAGRSIEWTRLGMTQEQADQRGITPIRKVDGRDGKGHWAIEVESLGQRAVVDLVRAALDARLPEPLEHVRERERTERDTWAAFLDTGPFE
jgi:hypothetical protein